MNLTVEELKLELEKYDENKKIRVLFGMPTRILWLSHDDHNNLNEGCVLVTSNDIKLHKRDRIETVGELLWNLQYFRDELNVWNNHLESCWSGIVEVSNDVRDIEGNLIDIVFIINFAHVIG